MLKKFPSTAQIFLVGSLLYILNKLIIEVFKITTNTFVLPYTFTFGMLLIASTIVMLVVDIVFIKNKDVVGMTFLFVTSVKVVALVIIAKSFQILENNPIEKWYFFILFMLFLSLETLLTALRLNKTKF